MSELTTRKLHALFLAAVLLPAAHAQFIQQGSKLVGSGAAGSPLQGSAVAVSADGNTAIVGGPGDNQNAGATWVYVRTNGIWSQQGPKLVANGFYVAISADGNTAIVDGTGGALIYTRTNGVWSQQGRLAVPRGPVAASGDGNTVIVGGLDGGGATVFTRTNGVWSQQGPKLVGTNSLGIDIQGGSVAISADNTVLVGGYGDNGGIGATWVFTRTNGVWTQQGDKLVGTGAVSPARQGTSVAISGDGNTAVVGGLSDNQFEGAVWVFTRTNGVWNQQGPKLVGSGAVGLADGIFQGESVAVSSDGNTAIVGGDHDNDNVGAAWAFTRTNGVWSQLGNKLVGTGAMGTTNQGISIALSGDGHTAIVGGPNDQPFGAAWVFVSAPVHLVVSAPASVTAGNPFSFTVTALDINNSIVTGYTGAVHFSTSDPIGVLPADSQLINGVGTFLATLKTVNLSSPTITVYDNVNMLITGNSAPIAVQPASTSRFAIATLPFFITLTGEPFNFTISAFDRFGNFAPSNTVRVHFTSSDPDAILPADSLLAAGTATFSAILKTIGNQTITVTDTSNSSVAGTSSSITVANALTSFNLAEGSLATQSSTYSLAPTAVATLAVDGNLDGNFYDGSVTATNLESDPWWETDLGSSATVFSMVIWNRTDCCGSALSDFWVFISDTPFLPTDSPGTLQYRAGTFANHQTLATGPNPGITINLNGVRGRYVRVQLSNGGILSLAEVQVYGGPGSSLTTSLAQGRPATQSSTFPGYPSAVAASAVDDATDGNFFDGSVTATNADPSAWWQVDLGASAIVSSIAIWNRTDCCGSRLSDYWVFVSDLPFFPTDTPATLRSRYGTFSSHQTAAPNPSAAIGFDSGVRGRYVRVQLTGTDYLSLAEVQVFGTGGAVPTNVALGKSAAQSSTLPGYATDGASMAVDGNTDGSFPDGSVTATNLDPNPWWQVDLGASVTVSSIVIWNRTDCCGSRLGDYWVFVSDTPFLPTDTPATLQNRSGTFVIHQTTAPNPSTTITLNSAQGRYVRVQLTSPGYLSLAEVQIFGQ